jgi:GNAT superfamily N-acetyltransferase
MLLVPSASEIILAMEANLQAHVSLLAGMPGAIICTEPGVVGLMTDLHVVENCVYWANFPPEQANQRIRQVLQRYHSAGCLPMWWIVGPSSHPSDLGTRLEELGFECFARPPGMAAPLENLVKPMGLPDHFVIERVSNPNQLKQWTRIIGEVDGISTALQSGYYVVFNQLVYDPEATSQLFLGLENGKPVATARLCCTSGVAGIWHIATLREAQGRGYGTAMTLAAARAGWEFGYHFSSLFATPQGYGVYRRLGFQEYCRLDVYNSPG